MTKETKLLLKAMKVVNSCETIEQLHTARNFVDLAMKKIEDKFDRIILQMNFLNITSDKAMNILKEKYNL